MRLCKYLRRPRRNRPVYKLWIISSGRYKGMNATMNGMVPMAGLSQDVDDRRRAGYGMYYTQKKPLNAAALEWRQEKKEPGI